MTCEPIWRRTTAVSHLTRWDRQSDSGRRGNRRARELRSVLRGIVRARQKQRWRRAVEAE